ncbi:MAG: uroporphyrinogen decarboxylase family protein [Armatimonadota bacterium]
MAKQINSLYKERFINTLNHKPVDRSPIDLGGTPQASVDGVDAIKNLAAFLGYDGDAPVDYNLFDKRILEHFDIDFRRTGDIVEFDTGRARWVSETEHIDSYGMKRTFTGLYWEQTGYPLADSGCDDIMAYDFPTEDQMIVDRIADYGEQAKWLHDNTPYVIAGWHPVFGVLELACWLCGYDHIMLMMALDPEFIHLLFSRILELQKIAISKYYSAVGPYIDLTTSGDDFGTQKGLFISPAMWREFVKPYMKERIEYTAKFTDAVYMHHSCGAIFDIIPDLIEIGVKIINPIQPAAAGMDPQRLKDAYGSQIVFHGGLDTQEVLPSNDFNKIDAAVENLLQIMDPNNSGGYIFAAAHNLQIDVNPSAVTRMYESALAVQGYSSR